MDYSDPVLHYRNEDGTIADPSVIEKIPDLIRDIPNFDGNSDELHTWIKDADALVRAYQVTEASSVNQKNKFYAICTTIRRKIKGEANNALVNSDVNISWPLVKKTLLEYYGEKRDLTTLDYQLMNCHQKGRNLEIFYDEINKLLSLIANQIKMSNEYKHPEASKAMIGMYNKKAIDAFVRGLDGDIGKFLKNHEPDSLANAYAYCITYQNIEYRKNFNKPKLEIAASNSRNLLPSLTQKYQPRKQFHPNYNFQHYAPPIPPRMQQIQRHQQLLPQNSLPFQQNPPQQVVHSRPQPPPPQRPLPFQQYPIQKQPSQQIRQQFEKPVPMDIDPSIRSRQVNYANRPNNRNFNIETNNEIETDEYIDELSHFTEESYPSGPSFDRYMYDYQMQEKQENEEEEEFELNFLG